MKKLTIALATTLALLLFAAPVLATTFHTITIDGDLVDWAGDELMETDAAKDLYITWDADDLYIGFVGTDWGSDGDFFIYLDTAPGGTTTSIDWNGTHTLAFEADYAFAVENGYINLRYYDGSTWQADQPFNGSTYIGWSGDTDTEISLPWDDIGLPSNLKVLLFAQNENDQGVWASWPTPNPANGAGGQTFTHFYHFASLVDGISPDDSVLADHIVINEFTAKDTEHIELYNPTDQTIDLTGWYLGDGDALITDTLSGSLTPGAYLDVATSLFLHNDGDEIILLSGTTTIDMVAYGEGHGGAPTEIAGGGYSIQRVPNGTDTDDDARDFNMSRIGAGQTFGAANNAAEVMLGSSLIINEINAFQDAGDEVTYDFFELYNPLDHTLVITNWYASDSGDGLQLISDTIPSGGWSAYSGTLFFNDVDVVHLWDDRGIRLDQITADAPGNELGTLQRIPNGAGPNDGWDWSTSGGDSTLFELPSTMAASNVVSTNVAIAKTGPATALSGDPIVYTLNFSVTTAVPATEGYIWDALPAEVDFVTYTLNPAITHVFTQTGSDLEWAFESNLLNGTNYVLSVIGDIDPIASGAITNEVSIDSVLNITPTDDYDSWTTEILQAGIAFTKTVGTDPMACATTSVITLPIGGDDVYYCYAVQNSGQVTFTLHDLEDDQLGTIFAGWPYTLEPGDSTFVTETAFITQTTLNTAIWTAYNSDVVSATDSAIVFVEGLAPDLYVAKRAVPTETFVWEGQPALITYTVTITNAGNQEATNVELVDTPPFGFEYITDNSGVTPTMSGGDIIWSLGNLTYTPGSNAISFQVWMSATDAITLTGPYYNLATVTADNDPIGDFSAASVQINRVLSIYDIQHVDDPVADDASPYEDKFVWVEGVATASSDDFDGIAYFIEDWSGGPWSGLHVYHYGDRDPVQEGDWLLLYGLVQEFYGLTELDLGDSAGGEQYVLSSGNPLPAPEVLATDTYSPTAVATAEAYEGVLLEFRSATVISDELGFGEWSFDDGSGEAHADDLSSSLTYTPTIGDYYVYIRGLGYYSYSEYKLAPRYDPDIMPPFTVTLAYHDLEDAVGTGEALYLAGDFNGWDPLALPMTPDAGYETFSATLYITQLGAGYKYVVYTDTIPSGPANWNWLQTNNRSLTPEGPGVVDDYRHVEPGYVVLQWPFTTTTMVGQPTEDIFGQIWADDLTSRPGAPRALLAELGYGVDPDPANWTTWGAMAWSSQQGNNDEFSGVMTPTAAGVYSYVVRFNANWGPGNPYDVWSYGDTDGVHPGDPFEIANAGVLTVTPSVGPLLSIVKSVDDGAPVGDRPDLGDPVTYTVVVANDGEADAEDVHVWDVPQDPDCIVIEPLDEIVTVLAHDQVTFTVPAVVSDNVQCYGVRVDNTAYYSHTSGTDQDSTYFYIAAPSFLLTKVADPDTDVPYHGLVTYTVRLRNIGTTDAHDILFTDTLPVEVDFAYWIEQPAGASVVDDEITWTGTVTEDGQIYFIFAVQHVGDYSETVRNTARITHFTLSQPRTAYDDFTVESQPVVPSLSIAKMVYPETNVTYHGEVTYTVSLANAGLGDALGVALTDALPSQVTFARWLDQPAGADVISDVVTWTGTVPGSGVLTFTFVVTHVGDYGDVVTNTAEYAYGEDADSASAAFSVEEAGPILSVGKDVAPTANVPLNSTVTYSITLANSGGAVALGVVLTDVLPSEVVFGGWVIQGGADETDGTITWAGDISATTDVTLVFTATVVGGDPGASVTNVAQYVSDDAGSGSDDAVFTLESEAVYRIYLPIIIKN